MRSWRRRYRSYSALRRIRRASAAGLEVHDADRADPVLVDRAVQQQLDLVEVHSDEALGQGEDLAHPDGLGGQLFGELLGRQAGAVGAGHSATTSPIGPGHPLGLFIEGMTWLRAENSSVPSRTTSGVPRMGVVERKAIS